MPQAAQFTLGADAACSDGTCGQIQRVIVDPVAEAVTHLVVEPAHQPGTGRLVPLDLVDATTYEIRILCSRAEFEKLERAEDSQFIAGRAARQATAPGQVGYWPYYGLGGIGMGPGGMGMGGIGMCGGNAPHTVTTDCVPLAKWRSVAVTAFTPLTARSAGSRDS